ncbi:MAG: protein meaA, partial [Deltaproteobacteria bacterium]|nr:protein meaA [Deltaproteobacteria bacterium]
AGVTTGEWTDALREVFGTWRPPASLEGVDPGPGHPVRSEVLAARVRDTAAALGCGIRLLVGKPGLDGHSNGAEQVALKARQAGFEVIYHGIRTTPTQIAEAALEEGVHAVGLSILSGSHLELVTEVMERLRAMALEVPVVVGGIIPDGDASLLRSRGVQGVFTPGDRDLNVILAKVLDVVRASRGLPVFGDLPS